MPSSEALAAGPVSTGNRGTSKRRLVVYGVIVLFAVGVISNLSKPAQPAGSAEATARPIAKGTSSPPANPSSANEVSAAPTIAPSIAFAAFEPITLSGKGSKVPKFDIPADAPALATIQNAGGGTNFAVWSISADGTENDLLVNVIGNYNGTLLFDSDDGEHSVAFKIDSGGSWKITILPIFSARPWDGQSQLTGTGDDVILIPSQTSGLTTATAIHDGDSNFAVTAYGESGRDLLINDIGKYHAEVLIPPGALLLTIAANDNWSITP